MIGKKTIEFNLASIVIIKYLELKSYKQVRFSYISLSHIILTKFKHELYQYNSIAKRHRIHK